MWTATTSTLAGSELRGLYATDSSYDVCPRYVFDPIFQKVYYEMLPSRGAVRSVSPQELAIVFITMAFGSLHDLELPPNDPVSVDFYTTARLCLVKGKFLIHNTLAGVRTLVSFEILGTELTSVDHGPLLLVSLSA